MKIVKIERTAGYVDTAKGSEDLGVKVNDNGDLLIVDRRGRICAAVASGRWISANMEDSNE